MKLPLVMLSELKHRALTGFDDLSAHEILVVLRGARALQRAAHDGTPMPLLLGKNIALMAPSADDAEGRRLCRAAVELGAQVAHVRADRAKLGSPAEVRQTAGMLGRLYDAIVCQGMAPADVRRIRAEVGVPVYENLASDDHPTAALAARLDADEDDPEDRRRHVLQAVLLTLA